MCRKNPSVPVSKDFHFWYQSNPDRAGRDTPWCTPSGLQSTTGINADTLVQTKKEACIYKFKPIECKIKQISVEETIKNTQTEKGLARTRAHNLLGSNINKNQASTASLPTMWYYFLKLTTSHLNEKGKYKKKVGTNISRGGSRPNLAGGQGWGHFFFLWGQQTNEWHRPGQKNLIN